VKLLIGELIAVGTWMLAYVLRNWFEMFE